MAGAGVTTVLLLLLAMGVFTCGALHTVTTAVQPTDSAGTEKTGKVLPVHHDSGNKEETAVDKLAEAGDVAASLASTEDAGKMIGADWGKVKKMDDDDDDDHDSDSDHDHDSDHDSNSDHDHDSDSDHDHDHDSDSDRDHDHDSDSDHDHDSDHDSNSDHDSDSDCDHNPKHGWKKHAAPGRKENPGGKHDDELPNVAIKV